MYYELLNLFLKGEDPTNLFIIGKMISNKSDSKIGYYDSQKDIVFLHQNNPTYQTIILIDKVKSEGESTDLHGYYEFHDSKEEMLIEYKEYVKKAEVNKSWKDLHNS